MCAGKRDAVMYVDENEKKRAIERINSFIWDGDSFGLETTAVPVDKFDAVRQWNDQVVLWLRQFYGNGTLRDPFENEVKRFLSVGDSFLILMKELKGLLIKINKGEDRFFRRFSRDEQLRIISL